MSACVLGAGVWKGVGEVGERIVLPSDHLVLVAQSQISELGYQVTFKQDLFPFLPLPPPPPTLNRAFQSTFARRPHLSYCLCIGTEET